MKKHKAKADDTNDPFCQHVSKFKEKSFIFISTTEIQSNYSSWYSIFLVVKQFMLLFIDFQKRCGQVFIIINLCHVIEIISDLFWELLPVLI